MRTRRRVIAVFLICLIVGWSIPVAGQSTSTQIQIAINSLITGVTTFTTERLTAGRYILWGTGADAAGYGLRDNAGVIEVKSSGGAWTPIVTGATLPTDASFITRVSESALTNETALGSLDTGLLINTTTTGVPTVYAGASCTNQFPRSLSAIGAATCASVALTADVTGTLPVANGGLGITTGTSGGILGFTAAGTLGSSGALTANAIVLGGGAGSTPTVLGSLGTTTTILHGNAGGAPTFSAASLTADVSGILPTANGGTGLAYFTAAGPSVARTYTFPDASTTVLTTNAAVTAAQGGTGQTSYTTGDIVYASAATTIAKLIDAATGNALISGGAGVAPSYGKIGLTTHVSGTLAVGNGGTGLASYTTGDLLTASSASTLASIIDVTAGSFLRSGGAATIPAWSTTTWPNAATTGDLLIATSTNAIGSLADVAVNRVLISGGAGVAPSYSATPIVTSVSPSGSQITAGADDTTVTAGDVTRTRYQATITPASAGAGNCGASFLAAALTADCTVATLPAGAKLVGVYADVTAGFTCSGTCSGTKVVQCGTAVGGTQVLAAGADVTTTARYGLADADLGSGMTRAAAIQGGLIGSWTTTTPISCRFTSGTGNWGSGAATFVNAGSIKLTLIAEQLK